MPKRDFAQIAFDVVQRATGAVPLSPQPKGKTRRENPRAISLSSLDVSKAAKYGKNPQQKKA